MFTFVSTVSSVRVFAIFVHCSIGKSRRQFYPVCLRFFLGEVTLRSLMLLHKVNGYLTPGSVKKPHQLRRDNRRYANHYSGESLSLLECPRCHLCVTASSLTVVPDICQNPCKRLKKNTQNPSLASFAHLNVSRSAECRLQTERLPEKGPYLSLAIQSGTVPPPPRHSLLKVHSRSYRGSQNTYLLRLIRSCRFVSRCGLAVRRLAGKQKDLGSIRFGSPFSSLQKLWFMDTVLWLCPHN